MADVYRIAIILLWKMNDYCRSLLLQSSAIRRRDTFTNSVFIYRNVTAG